MPKISRRAVLAGFAALPGFVTKAAAADPYPARPVKVVVPFPAGGVTDVIARLWAQAISDRLDKPFFVENQGGGGSNIGMGNAARQPADGYSLLMAASSFTVNPGLYKKIPYEPINDFSPVTMLAVTPSVLIVTPSFKAKTFAELVKTIHNEPGAYGMANAGIGTPPMLQGELMKLKLKLDMTAVPFSGGGQLVQNVVAGHVPVGFTALTAIPPLVEAGKLRAIAVTGAARTPLLPDVPTFKEEGLDDMEAGTFVGLLARRGTPQPIVDRLYDETTAILKLPDVLDRLRKVGAVPYPMTSVEFADRLQREIAEWARIIQIAQVEKQ